MQEILLELFSIPIRLKSTVKVDDVQLYGSSSLDKNYKKAISNSESASFVSDQISKLVDNGRVNLCYLNKGIIRVLLWKVLVVHPFKSVLAFFSTSTNKVYIIIDNNIGILGHVSNKLLGSLTIHECCHMSSFNNYSSFFNLFSEDLTNYYSNYFKELFKLDNISEKDVKNFAFSLIKSETQKDRGAKILPVIEGFLDSLKKSFKGDSKEFEEIKDRYIIVCKAVLGGWDSQAFKDVMNSKKVIAPLYKAYRTTFGLRTKNVLHCQEVVTASEVVCVYSEIAPKEKILPMLSLIK
jgi:hypothetical protein